MSLQQKNISLNYIYISIKDFCFFYPPNEHVMSNSGF